VITIQGKVNQKKVLFSELEPTDKELEELIKEYNAAEAFVTAGKVFAVSEK
jgi:hypothetical protein